ncbi:MAG: tetratricopeptide repeat protein [Candidatus Binatia bacterium]
MTTPDRRSEPPAAFDTKQAARIVGLPTGRLRQCVRAGLVAPARDGHGRLRFDFVDLVLLRTTRGLLASRVPLKTIGRVLTSLRRQIGDRPLTRLSVYADGKRVVAWDGATRWQPESGQFLFNFDAESVLRRATTVAKLPSPKRAKLPGLTADQWCDLAMEIEEASPLEARAAYHHALDLDPGSIVARINLGRLLHAESNLVGAEAHFREAVRYDPSCALAWYNLGVVLEDRACPDDALPCYEHAVHADHELADAHWNLSLLYEKSGRHRDALRHLAQYRKLTAKRR